VNGNLIRKVRVSSQPVGKVLGSVTPRGELKCGVDKGYYKVHRVVWKWYYGTDPEDRIDHIDRNPGNNNIWNLRVSDAILNSHNNTLTMDKHNGQLQCITIDGKLVRTDYGRKVARDRMREERAR